MAKTLLIIGASSDIGCALIGLVGSRYDRCLAHCRSGERRIRDAAAGAGLPVVPLQASSGLTILTADLTSPVETAEMLDEIKTAGYCPDDMVYLPAAPFSYNQFRKLDPARFIEQADVAVMPAVRIFQAILPEMAARRSGHVVTMLSAVTVGKPPKYLADYTAAKYALWGLTRSLAAEYEEKGLKINGVSPEMTDTRYLDGIPEKMKDLAAMQSSRGTLLKPEEVASVIVRLFTVSGADVPNGENLPVPQAEAD